MGTQRRVPHTIWYCAERWMLYRVVSKVGGTGRNIESSRVTLLALRTIATKRSFHVRTTKKRNYGVRSSPIRRRQAFPSLNYHGNLEFRDYDAQISIRIIR